MAKTNFAALTNEQLTAWGKKFWHHARTNAFVTKFTGTGSNSMIDRTTELTKSKKGNRAVITLLADMRSDGAMGDARLEDNEEALVSFDTVIQFDQIRNANRTTGRMADQKSVVTFRGASENALGYWASDRIDQMAFLSLSSVPYTRQTNGALRPVLGAGYNLSDLEFAPAPAVAPTANRCFYLTAAGLSRGTGNDAADGALVELTYKALVQMKAAAKSSFIRPIKRAGGQELYHVFVTPMGMADLRLDPDFLANVRGAGVRGDSNALFSGTDSVMVDGMLVSEFHHVYSNEGAALGSRFGATGNDIGQRVLFCGAQALGMADIGTAEWVEDQFDYKSENGISISKMVGFLKPQFKGNLSSYDTVEDYGCMTIDTAVTAFN
jgi:N4-gp56 family major capsid protein